MASYRRNFVRLADKAVRDYMDGRSAVEAQIKEAKRPPEQIARPVDRLFKKQLAALENGVVNIRDLIEHLDKEIKNQGIAYGQNTAATLNEDASTIILGGSQLPVSALARCIEHFHSFAMEFAQYRIAPNGAYERIPKSGHVKANSAAAQ